MKRLLLLAAVVLALGVSGAQAQPPFLSPRDALKAAISDARYAQHHTVNAKDSGYTGCVRKSRARIDCAVWIQGGELRAVIDANTALYDHFTWEWTDVVRATRRGVRYGRIDMKRTAWTDYSSTP